MGPGLHDAAVVQDDDAPRLVDRRQAVGDDEGRAAGEEAAERAAAVRSGRVSAAEREQRNMRAGATG